MHHAQKAAGLVGLAGLALAAWFAIVLARAGAEFRKGAPEDVARAVALAPRDTRYLSLQALQVEYAGGDPRPLLEQIARIAPFASAPRIRLGLDAEIRGDARSAELWLLDAARVDHQYEPRWTLAQFYFRQQRMDEFWEWLREALEVSYGDRRAAFDLAFAAAPDANIILARAVPEERNAIAAFLAYVEHNHGDAAPAALKLARWRDPADLPLLYGAVDDLLDAGRGEAARQVWINLGYPGPPLLANPDFGPPRIGHGFDWRFAQIPGVAQTPLDAPPALRISLNGMEPEACELLRQYTGVRMGRRYILRWESRGTSSGISWQAGPATAPLSAGQDWTAGRLSFQAEGDFGAVALIYKRPLGEPRIEGSLELRHVAIEEQP